MIQIPYSGLVWNLRNAIAHSQFEPIHKDNQVRGFKFTDNNDFKAQIELSEMRDFVEKIASHLEFQSSFSETLNRI